MRNSTVLISALAIGALIGGGAMGIPSIRNKIVQQPQQQAAAPAATTTEQQAAAPAQQQPAATQEQAPAPTAAATTTQNNDATRANQVAPSAAGLDVKAALKERVLGNPNAPVTFYDYSSLSCPHCAEFHNNVLPDIKRAYIDTGKVKMVFRPFPLNEPALMAEKIARCMPEDQYFAMLDLLFSTQSNWLQGDAKKNILRSIKVAGVTEEFYETCLANKELEEGIVEIARTGQQRFNLRGTPTFVFGEDGPKGEVVSGENFYEAFSDRFDKMLSDKMVPTPGRD